MEKKIGERMDRLASEGLCDYQRIIASIDQPSARRHRLKTLNVTYGTAYSSENVRPSLDRSSVACGDNPRRHLGRSHEASECRDIVLGVIWLGDMRVITFVRNRRVANLGEFVWLKPIRNSHFIEVRVGSKRE